eukprot:CFRG6215T1
MFRKPFKVKTNAAIKSSENKKLRGSILKTYPDAITAEQLDAVLPVKGDVRLAKLQTHDNGIIQCYCLNAVPLFFQTKDGPLIPTVYALWELPGCVPTLITNTYVMKKIDKGADLMLPGVCLPGGDPKYFPPMTVGSIVAVSDGDSCGAMAVGKMLKSASDINLDGMRGKGVEIVHTYSDYMWEFGPQTQPPNAITRNDTWWCNTSFKNSELQGECGSGIDSAHEEVDDNHGDGDNLLFELQNVHLEESPSESLRIAELSPDEALKYAFLTSLRSSAKSDSLLPMLVSSFFAVHMIPSRHPSTTALDIKGSSYKKIGKFLDQMEKEGIIKLQEQGKGVSVIVSVDRTHEALTEHRICKDSEDKANANARGGGGIKQELSVVDVYRPHQVLSFLFDEKMDLKSQYHTPTQLRQHIQAYAQKHGLISRTNPRNIVCDPYLGKLTPNIEARLDDLCKLALTKCQSFHRVTLPDGSLVIRKGNFQPVEIVHEQRMGRKTVTLIRKLKAFEVPLSTFAKDLASVIASSTTVQSATAGNPDDQEVLAQGNAITAAVKLLSEKYGVNKKHIKVTDKTGKGSKKKK